MTEVKIIAIYSQFLGEFIANFKDSYSLYSLVYSPMCLNVQVFRAVTLFTCIYNIIR